MLPVPLGTTVEPAEPVVLASDLRPRGAFAWLAAARAALKGEALTEPTLPWTVLNLILASCAA